MEVFGNIVYFIIVAGLIFPVDWILKAIVKKYKEDANKKAFFILAIIDRAIFLLASVTLFCYIFTDKPEAIDVYRGKTELYIEQSIRGGEVVESDTTVVFKREKPIE